MAKILIVDDDPLVFLLFKNILTTAGHDAIPAANGLDALATISAAEPDLVFMDVMMPVMDGIAALRELRKQDPSHCPVVMITANVKEYGAVQLEATLAGAAGFLRKPLTRALILAEIERFISE